MLQFGSMDLHLRCDEAFLRLRQAAAKALDCVEGEDGRVLLIVRMVGPVHAFGGQVVGVEAALRSLYSSSRALG